jgi:hypothetical protein
VGKREMWFDVTTGVRQGSVLSPLLFIILMDQVIRKANNFACMDQESDIFAYADDIGLITCSVVELQTKLEAWNQSLTEHGLKLNKVKSEVMVVSRVPQTISISIEGEQLKQTHQFKYLGMDFDRGAIKETAINERISKYSANVGLLYPLLKDKHIPTTCKVAIYISVLRPVLLYGCESWTLTSKFKSKVQAAEMRVLRLIKGVTRRDRLRNDDIRNELEVQNILTYIEETQLRWYGHVKRMKDERAPLKWLRWKPSGKRPTGRPRKRWME